MPAGVPTGTQKFARPDRSVMNLDVSWCSSMSESSKPQSNSASLVPSGWRPQEADTMPTQGNRAAGMVGVVDNTVRYSPLPPKYGKTREGQPGESVALLGRTLAAATLAETKGLKAGTIPHMSSAEYMPSVLPKYGKGVPLEYKMDPTRLDSGFVSSPAAHRGTRTLPSFAADLKISQPIFAPCESPNASPTSTMNKFDFDRTAGALTIPVARRFF